MDPLKERTNIGGKSGELSSWCMRNSVKAFLSGGAVNSTSYFLSCLIYEWQNFAVSICHLIRANSVGLDLTDALFEQPYSFFQGDAHVFSVLSEAEGEFDSSPAHKRLPRSPQRRRRALAARESA